MVSHLAQPPLAVMPYVGWQTHWPFCKIWLPVHDEQVPVAGLYTAYTGHAAHTPVEGVATRPYGHPQEFVAVLKTWLAGHVVGTQRLLENA